MSLVKQFQDIRAQAETEWQNNRRLRAGGIITLCLLLIWVLVQANDWRKLREAAAQDAYYAYLDVQAAVRDSGWAQRASLASSEYEKLSGWFWEAANPGEAQARLRDWLEQKARENGVNLQPVVVSVGRSPPGTDFVPVRAEIKGQYAVGALQNFLRAIGDYRPVLLVETEELDFRNENNQKYQINVTGWFILGSGVQ